MARNITIRQRLSVRKYKLLQNLQQTWCDGRNFGCGGISWRACQRRQQHDKRLFSIFCAHLCFSERRKAVRIEGYAEAVVPRYDFTEFQSHFRLSVETFEQLVVELGICPKLPTGPQYGGKEPISVEKHLLITLWVLGNQESIRSVSNRFNVTKSSMFNCVNRVCRALENNIQARLLFGQPKNELRWLWTVFGITEGCQVWEVRSMAFNPLIMALPHKFSSLENRTACPSSAKNREFIVTLIAGWNQCQLCHVP